MPSANYNAWNHKEWEAAGLLSFEDFSDAIEYVNQRDIGDQLEGGWWYSDDDKMTIYTGTFGNYNSPGASSYTKADIYDDADEFKAEIAKLEAMPEYVDDEDDINGEDTESTFCGSIPVSELADHAKECGVCRADLISRGLIEDEGDS